jgi:hypothetical protein
MGACYRINASPTTDGCSRCLRSVSRMRATPAGLVLIVFRPQAAHFTHRSQSSHCSRLLGLNNDSRIYMLPLWRPGTLGTARVFNAFTLDRLGTDLEHTGTSGRFSLRYRHSNRVPCRSRYRFHPNALRHRAARFLSVWVHNACGFCKHFSRTSLIDTLERASSHGAMTSSHGSPSYRSIC